jgi:hypothetical protein
MHKLCVRRTVTQCAAVSTKELYENQDTKHRYQCKHKNTVYNNQHQQHEAHTSSICCAVAERPEAPLREYSKHQASWGPVGGGDADIGMPRERADVAVRAVLWDVMPQLVNPRVISSVSVGVPM